MTIEDDAIYQCQVGAFGEASPIRSAPARLKVMVPPGVPKILQGDVTETVAGVETVLECSSSGGRPAGEVYHSNFRLIEMKLLFQDCLER